MSTFYLETGDIVIKPDGNFYQVGDMKLAYNGTTEYEYISEWFLVNFAKVQEAFFEGFTVLEYDPKTDDYFKWTLAQRSKYVGSA